MSGHDADRVMLLVAHTGKPAAIRVARVLLDKLISGWHRCAGPGAGGC